MIYLLAGHSNIDSGAIGVNNIKESDLTKVIRDLVYKRVKEINPKSFVTKDDDRDTLSQVIAKIKPNISSTDGILDIHYNAGGAAANGIECIVSDNASTKSIKVATEINDIISKVTGLKNRGVKREKDTPRKKLGILNLKGWAVILEVGFITNQGDLDKINNNLHWLCEEIALILIKNA